LTKNPEYDLTRKESGYTGTFYKGFLREKPDAISYKEARGYATAAGVDLPKLNLKELRELLVGVRWIFDLSLTRSSAAEVLPMGIEYRPEHAQSATMVGELVNPPFCIAKCVELMEVWRAIEMSFFLANKFGISRML
jgi:hypothetical protein